MKVKIGEIYLDLDKIIYISVESKLVYNIPFYQLKAGLESKTDTLTLASSYDLADLESKKKFILKYWDMSQKHNMPEFGKYEPN